MQETLTHKNQIYVFFKIKSQKKSQTSMFFIMITILIILFIILYGCFINYKNHYNKTQYFYLLSLNSTTAKKQVDNIQEAVNEFTGVSIVYNLNSVYHIIGFIYVDLSTAQEVLQSVKGYFAGAQIIKTEGQKLRSKVFKELKNQGVAYNAYKEILKVKGKFLDLCGDVENGKNLSRIYRELTKIQMKLEDYYQFIKSVQGSKIVDNLKISYNSVIAIIVSHKDEIIMGGDLLENVKLLYMESCFEEVELRNSLNKL